MATRTNSGFGGSLSQPTLPAKAPWIPAPAEPRIGIQVSVKSPFVKIRTGLAEHMEMGKLTLHDLGVYLSIHMQADYEKGTWIGSAGKVLHKCPQGANLRRIQRSIAHLEAIGFLKCFRRKRGSRGNFACIINKFEVPFGALKGHRVNAEKTKTFENIVYEVCAEDALKRHCADADVTPIQDVDVDLRVRERQTGLIGATPQFVMFWEAYPNKVDREKAVGIWNEQALDGHIFKILEAVETWSRTDQWKGGYVPNPASWLKGKRWTDQVPQERKRGNNGNAERTKRTEAAGENFLRIVEKMAGSVPADVAGKGTS